MYLLSMKRLILISTFLAFAFNSQAGELTNKISETASDFISNLIPGEGTTEVSIDLRENYSPDFSILGVERLKRILRTTHLCSSLYLIQKNWRKKDMLVTLEWVKDF